MNWKVILIGILVLLAILAVVSWWWSQRPAVPPAAEEEKPASLGAQVFEKTQNPVKEELQQTNPFEGVANPLEGVYKNPFAK